MQISMQMFAIFTTASSVRNKRRAIYDYAHVHVCKAVCGLRASLR